MIKTKVAFLEGRLLSSQSKQLKKYLESSDSFFSFFLLSSTVYH